MTEEKIRIVGIGEDEEGRVELREKRPIAVQMTLDGDPIYHYRMEEDEVLFIDALLPPTRHYDPKWRRYQ